VLLRAQNLTSFGPIPDFRYEAPVTKNLGHFTLFVDGILNSYLTEDTVYYHDWLMLCREIITLYYNNQKIKLPRKSSEFFMLQQVVHIVTNGFHTVKGDCTMQAVG
jgi:hypothetical protein